MSRYKPHIKKVKCIIYWNPEDIEGHTPVPGYEVTVAGDLYGLGETIKQAWEDYLLTLEQNPVPDD
jgi:hypothetical protein